jgi:hypothetical protein
VAFTFPARADAARLDDWHLGDQIKSCAGRFRTVYSSQLHIEGNEARSLDDFIAGSRKTQPEPEEALGGVRRGSGKPGVFSFSLKSIHMEDKR